MCRGVEDGDLARKRLMADRALGSEGRLPGVRASTSSPGRTRWVATSAGFCRLIRDLVVTTVVGPPVPVHEFHGQSPRRVRNFGSASMRRSRSVTSKNWQRR